MTGGADRRATLTSEAECPIVQIGLDVPHHPICSPAVALADQTLPLIRKTIPLGEQGDGEFTGGVRGVLVAEVNIIAGGTAEFHAHANFTVDVADASFSRQGPTDTQVVSCQSGEGLKWMP